jgi:hypothetical protein
MVFLTFYKGVEEIPCRKVNTLKNQLLEIDGVVRK